MIKKSGFMVSLFIRNDKITMNIKTLNTFVIPGLDPGNQVNVKSIL